MFVLPALQRGKQVIGSLIPLACNFVCFVGFVFQKQRSLT